MAALCVASISGCAALVPPDNAALAALPVVVYPAKPAPGVDAVYEIPAGVPVEVKVVATGTALTTTTEKVVAAELAHTVYLYKSWASDDDRHWVRATDLLHASLKVQLPSYQNPGPGAITLTVDARKG